MGGRPRIVAVTLLLSMLLAINVLPTTSATDAAAAVTDEEMPTELTAWPAVDGVLLTWRHPPLAQGHVVYRQVEDGPWEVLARSSEHHFLKYQTDRTLPAGVTAAYAVAAIWHDGDGTVSSSITYTRPLAQPQPGDIDAVTIDVAAPGPPSYLADAGDSGSAPDKVTLWGDGTSLQATSAALGTAYVSIPNVAATGRYAIGPDATPFRIARQKQCRAESGWLDVQELAYDDRRRPAVYTAEYELRCEDDGTPVVGVIRWRSSHGYAGATEQLSGVGIPALSLHTTEVRDVTVRNGSRQPIDLGDAEVVPAADHRSGAPLPGAADWQLESDGCRGTLAPGDDCRVSVRFTPADRDVRTAVLRIADNTKAGARRVELHGIGKVLPGMPPDPLASTTVAQVHLWLRQPDPGNSTLATFSVRRRRAGTTTWTLVDTRPVEAHQPARWDPWVDRGLVPGTTYEYDIRATNELGEGAPRVVTVTVPRDDIVFRHPQGQLTGYALGSASPVQHPLTDDAGVRTPAVSPEGRWLVFSRHQPAGNDLVKVPAWGTGNPVALTSLPGDELEPTWSPDGTTIAFTRVRNGSSSVWTLPAAGGTATRRATGVAEPTWLPDSQTLIVADAVDEGGPLVRVEPTGQRSTLPGTEGARLPQVSPDGRLLAFLGTGTHPQIGLRPLHGSSTPTWTKQKSAAHLSARWSGDATTILASTLEGTGALTPVVRAYRVSGSPATLTLADRLHPAQLEPLDLAVRSLGVHLRQAPRKTSGSTRIDFGVTLPAADTTTRCRLDRHAWQPCTSPWHGSGLAEGLRTLTIEAREPDGRRTVTAHAWTVDTTPPAVRVTSPSTPVLTADRATVAYTATDDAGVASYDVRYRRARFDAGFGSHVYPESWQKTTATTQSVAATRGFQYCFSVRARDRLGNRSTWSTERCSSRPLDDRALSASTGWTRATGSKHLDGTVTSTTRRGAELTRASVQARRVYIVATRCPTCGTADVFIGSTRIGRVDLAAPSTQYRHVIALPVQSKVLTGKLTIRTTSSGQKVAIDGVAFRRN